MRKRADVDVDMEERRRERDEISLFLVLFLFQTRRLHLPGVEPDVFQCHVFSPLSDEPLSEIIPEKDRE